MRPRRLADVHAITMAESEADGEDIPVGILGLFLGGFTLILHYTVFAGGTEA